METFLSKNYKFFVTVFIAGLCILTTLISVGFGALNQNLNIAGDIEYVQDSGNMIKEYTDSTTTDFHSPEYKDKIKTIDFLDTKTIPANAVSSWDVSVNSDGKVMAWIVDDPNNTGYYKCYIGADGDVVGNANSNYLFDDLSGVEVISFNNNFDTSKVTNMDFMFFIYPIEPEDPNEDPYIISNEAYNQSLDYYSDPEGKNKVIFDTIMLVLCTIGFAGIGLYTKKTYFNK